MKLEKIVNNGKNILAGAGLISLLSLSAVRCATGDDYDYSGGGGTPTRSRYSCDCEGNGIFATMEIYADSRYSAESATTAQCREDYPGTGCSCDCVIYRSNPGGRDAGNNCTPDCYGKECGSDGCGGSCGSCNNNESCAGGECVPEGKSCRDECGPWAEGRCEGFVLYVCDYRNHNPSTECLEWIQKMNCQETCEMQGYENYRCLAASNSCSCD